MEQDLVAAKLAGDDPPAAAENLKLLLTLKRRTWKPFMGWSASSMSRTGSLRPTTMMGRPSFLVLLEQVLKVYSPWPVVADDLGAVLIDGDPALRTIKEGKAVGVGLVLLSYDLRLDKIPQIGVRGWFAGPSICWRKRAIFDASAFWCPSKLLFCIQ